MEKHNLLNIPFLLCKCGNVLSSENILGEYMYVLEPTLKNMSAIEAGKKRKQFFLSKNLYRLCCWNKVQTYFDPLPIALMDTKQI